MAHTLEIINNKAIAPDQRDPREKRNIRQPQISPKSTKEINVVEVQRLRTFGTGEVKR